MGNKSSRGNEQVNISINHPKFHNSKIFRKVDREVLKTVISSDQKTYKAWKLMLSKNKIEHEHLLTAIKHQYKSSGLCATKGSIEIDYDNYPYLLTEQIYNRKGKKVMFTEAQLWYLLYCYLSAKNYLAEVTGNPNALIGDIQPQNVFLNQNGQIKLANMTSWPDEKNNYEKTFQGYPAYLSPEDIELLELGMMENSQNIYSQTFSIGLTMLSVGILKDNSDLYNNQNHQLNQYEAKKRINAFKCSTAYSQLLRAIIGSFCAFDPRNRLVVNEVWTWITKYQRRIICKQPFVVDQVPPKINQHVNQLRADISQINPESSSFSIRSLRSSNHNQRSGATSFRSNDINRVNSRVVMNQEPLQGYKSPPPANIVIPIHALKSPQKNLNYNQHRVIRSPEGYYSPKNVVKDVKPFRVFIQYKSPTKPIDKPFSETVYVGREENSKKNAQQRQMELKKSEDHINSDNKSEKSKKSEKSNNSNRENRFIEETKRQQLNDSRKSEQNAKKQQISSEYNLNKQITKNIVHIVQNEKPYKKESPILKVIENENVQKTQSEVVPIVDNQKTYERQTEQIINKVFAVKDLAQNEAGQENQNNQKLNEGADQKEVQVVKQVVGIQTHTQTQVLQINEVEYVKEVQEDKEVLHGQNDNFNILGIRRKVPAEDEDENTEDNKSTYVYKKKEVIQKKEVIEKVDEDAKQEEHQPQGDINLKEDQTHNVEEDIPKNQDNEAQEDKNVIENNHEDNQTKVQEQINKEQQGSELHNNEVKEPQKAVSPIEQRSSLQLKSQQDQQKQGQVDFAIPEYQSSAIPVYQGGKINEEYYNTVNWNMVGQVKQVKRQTNPLQEAQKEAQRVAEIIKQQLIENLERDEQQLLAYEASHVQSQRVEPQQMKQQFTDPIKQDDIKQVKQQDWKPVQFDTPSEKGSQVNQIQTYQSGNINEQEYQHQALNITPRSVLRSGKQTMEYDMQAEQERVQEQVKRKLLEKFQEQNREQQNSNQQPQQYQAGHQQKVDQSDNHYAEGQNMKVLQAIVDVTKSDSSNLVNEKLHSQNPNNYQQEEQIIAESQKPSEQYQHTQSHKQTQEILIVQDNNESSLEKVSEHQENANAVIQTQQQINHNGSYYQSGVERDPIPIGPEHDRQQHVHEIHQVFQKTSSEIDNYPEQLEEQQSGDEQKNPSEVNQNSHKGQVIEQLEGHKESNIEEKEKEDKQRDDDIKITIKEYNKPEAERKDSASVADSSLIGGSGQVHSRYVDTEDHFVEQTNQNKGVQQHQNILQNQENHGNNTQRIIEQQLSQSNSPQKVSYLHQDFGNQGKEQEHAHSVVNIVMETVVTEKIVDGHVVEHTETIEQKTVQIHQEQPEKITYQNLHGQNLHNDQANHTVQGQVIETVTKIVEKQINGQIVQQSKTQTVQHHPLNEEDLHKLQEEAQVNNGEQVVVSERYEEKPNQLSNQKEPEEIKNSQIQFSKVQEVIGMSKDLKEKDPNHDPNAYRISNHPTESEFGNISEIMDINKQFNNTLNGAQGQNVLAFLLESSSGYKGQQIKPEDLFKELMAMNEQGVLNKEDIQRISTGQISKEDKQRIQLIVSRARQSKSQGASSPSDQTQKVAFSASGHPKQIHSIDGSKDKPAPSIYDQSNVDIIYSEMKTQAHQKIAQQMAQLNKNQQPQQDEAKSSPIKFQDIQIKNASHDANYDTEQKQQEQTVPAYKLPHMSSQHGFEHQVNINQTTTTNMAVRQSESNHIFDIVQEAKELNQKLNNSKNSNREDQQEHAHGQIQTENNNKISSEQQEGNHDNEKKQTLYHSHSYSEPNKLNSGYAHDQENNVQIVKPEYEQINEEYQQQTITQVVEDSNDRNRYQNQNQKSIDRSISRSKNKDILSEAIQINNVLHNTDLKDPYLEQMTNSQRKKNEQQSHREGTEHHKQKAQHHQQKQKAQQHKQVKEFHQQQQSHKNQQQLENSKELEKKQSTLKSSAHVKDIVDEVIQLNNSLRGDQKNDQE